MNNPVKTLSDNNNQVIFMLANALNDSIASQILLQQHFYEANLSYTTKIELERLKDLIGHAVGQSKQFGGNVIDIRNLFKGAK